MNAANFFLSAVLGIMCTRVLSGKIGIMNAIFKVVTYIANIYQILYKIAL